MQVRSLAYRTDLFFPAFEGKILDRGDYLVVRTPSNPTFYWGNFLLFTRPPQAGDEVRWRELFACEIGVPPAVEHQAFGWDSPEGEVGVIEPFVQAGFEASHALVLTSSAPTPPVAPAREIVIRPLGSDADWEEAVELHVLTREPVHDEEGYRTYRRRSMARYRRMVEADLGEWYGAFLGNQLVGDLGLFHREGIGRYQSVTTHPDFRRRGIAGTLVNEAGRRAMEKYDLQTLVIVAEEDSGASRLYQSVGFVPTEKVVDLLWFPHAAP